MRFQNIKVQRSTVYLTNLEYSVVIGLLKVVESRHSQHKPPSLPVVHHVTLLLQSTLLQELTHDVGVDLLDDVDLKQAHKLLRQLGEEGPEVYHLLATEPLLDVLLTLLVTVGLKDPDNQVHQVIHVHLQLTRWERQIMGINTLKLEAKEAQAHSLIGD